MSRLHEYYTGEEVLHYVSLEEQEALRQEVLQSLNNELVHPEDLETAVPKLRRSCETEGVELRRSMNSIVSLQIVEAQRALELVRSSSERVNGLREHFSRQASLVGGLKEETLPVKHLRRLHILRENIASVVNWATALKKLGNENLFHLIEKRQFALLYDHIKQLQQIRQTVIERAGSRYRVFEVVFEPYFSRLDLICHSLVAEITTLLENEAANLSIQKALMDSDAEDPAGFVAFRECCRVCLEELANPVLRSLSPSGAPGDAPGITTDVLNASLTANVERLWQQQVLVGHLEPLQEPTDYFHRLKKVEPLLEALQLALLPLSSETFFFFDVVLKALHVQVLDSMQVYVDNKGDLSANVLLEASQFIQWYKGMLISYKYASNLSLKEADELSAVFMTTAVNGLASHLSRLCRACAKAVFKNPPSVPQSGGLPFTTGPVDLFAILQQTLSGLSSSIDMKVLEQIGCACVDALVAFLTTLKECLDYDAWEEANATDKEWEQRRLFFLYAISNDCSTIESNLDSVENKFAVCWESTAISATVDPASGRDSPFTRVGDEIADLGLFLQDEIAEQIERVVAAQWLLAFRQGAWYSAETNPIQLILDTEADYFEAEFAVMVAEPKVRKLSTQILVRYTKNFVSSLLVFLADAIRNPKKNKVESWSAFIDNLVRDIESSQNTWKKLTREIHGELLHTCMDALSLMKELLCVRKVVDLEYVLRDKLMERFGDCPTFVIQFALESRPKEVPADLKDRMLSVWAALIRPQKRDANDVPTAGWGRSPSLFGQVDKAIGQFHKAGGFFSRSAKKQLLAERERAVEEMKAKKRSARLEK